jgi:uncharacterized membrane protein YheB (UPF0754 family)
MLTFIFLLVFQGFSGGVAGYITNKYAVDMLFKEYTPLKLGGVIKKKKEKFIEEISELVERDIVNADTLKAEMSNKNIDRYIKQLAETFFEKELKKSLGNTKTCEIDDFSNSILKSEEFIRKNLNAILPELLDNLMVNINLQDILSENQILKIVSSSHDLLVNELEKTNTLDEFISNLYKENSDLTLADIFSEEVLKKLIDNISECIIKIIKDEILVDEKSCKIFLDNVFSSINIDLTLTKLQGLLGDYEISQFITVVEQEKITLKLFNKINKFINSQKGRELVLNLIREIELIVKGIDFTIYEMLPGETEESLTYFIKTIVPKVMPYISEWISNNKESFDEMIETAIDEAIDNMDVNIKKLIVSKVRSALIGDVSSKNNIVNKIISYINNSLDDDSYGKLANSIIDYLKSKKVKDIVEALEKQNLFTSEEILEIVIKQFESHGKDILGSIIKTQCLRKMHKVVKFDLVKLFHTKLKPMLYENIFKNKDKICEKLINLTREFINSKGNELFNKNLSELFTYNNVSSFSNKFAKLASKILKKNKDIYSKKIEEHIAIKIKNVNLADSLANYKVDILELFVDNSVYLYKETVDKYKNYEVRELVNKYFNKNQLNSILINKGYPMLVSKLPNLLNGNIKKFAKNSLSKYNEDEICDIVQDFMGNQLKPLSVFGAVLGTVVGVIYQLIFPNSIGRYGFPSDIFNGVLSLGVMAFIGYVTNVIALWMIFHPYKENKIVAKIPFFKKFALGYIPAHKNQFAMGMAKLIDEELLNKEEINKSFNSHKGNMQSLLMALVKNNNYQILINYVRSKKQDLTKYIYEMILKYCNTNSDLSKRISSKLGESKLNTFIKKNYVLSIVPGLINSISDAKDNLVQLAENKLSSNYKVNDILPEAVSAEIQKYIENERDKFIQDKLRNIKKVDFISPIIENFKDYYELGIKKSCKDILDKDLLEKIKNNVEEKACIFFSNDFKVYLSNLIRQFLHNELDENNDIGSMFNGKIKRVIDSNIYILTAYFANRIIAYLQNKQDIIAINVQETIKDELNFFEKIAYATFGGDDIAYKVVDIILNKKLPVMLKDETHKLVDTAKATLDESIYPMKVSTLKIKAEEIDIEMLISNIFEQFSKNIDLKRYICNASNLILDSLMGTPLIEYLELCDLSSLNLVYKKLYNEVNIVKEDICNNISINRNALSKTVGEFLNEKIVTKLFDSYNSIIFNGITDAEIENCVSNILNVVTNSEETKKHLAVFLEGFYDNTLPELKIKQIIDKNILNEDIDKVIKYIFANIEFNEKNVVLVERIVQNAIDDNFDFISKDTKDYLTSKTIQTGLNSLNHNIVLILQEINLKNISNKQIDLLNPKEIDILFNSFAGDFFDKLRLYGIFGFVFGINAGLSFILWIADWKYSKADSKKGLNTLRDL